MRRNGDRTDAPTGRIEALMFQAVGYVALALAVIAVVAR